MKPWSRCVLIGLAVLAAASAPAQQACQERVLSLRFSPSAGRANNWCWAASGRGTRANAARPSRCWA